MCTLWEATAHMGSKSTCMNTGCKGGGAAQYMAYHKRRGGAAKKGGGGGTWVQKGAWEQKVAQMKEKMSGEKGIGEERGRGGGIISLCVLKEKGLC